MIPYTLDRRPDTGVNNVTLGIWLLIASEVMLFGAMFSAYALLRFSALDWPRGLEVLNIQFGLANTLVLSVLAIVSWQARAAPIGKATRMLLIVAGLSLTFVIVMTLEYSAQVSRGLVPSVNTFAAMYFTLTGLHALHVVAGLAANLWAFAGAKRVGEAMTRERIRALALYWTFVGIVWLFVLVAVYVA
jgi:cytochrome c oxidase subunit III